MTVCIAALSDKSTKAVLVADKMLTSVGGLPYQNDGTGDKIFKINENVHGMWCGGLTDANNILTIFRDQYPDTSILNVQQIAYALRESHLTYLMQIIERENIIGRGIPSIADFYGNQSINLTIDVRQQIQNNLIGVNLGSNTQFIICGKDEDGVYKIFLLQTNPRLVVVHVNEGYAQIGSGAGHAQYSMIHSRYNTELSQEEVERIVKSAKKKAEKDPMVGKETDSILLT